MIQTLTVFPIERSARKTNEVAAIFLLRNLFCVFVFTSYGQLLRYREAKLRLDVVLLQLIFDGFLKLIIFIAPADPMTLSSRAQNE